MAPTILIVGATGNTGRGVMDALPKLLSSSTLSDHRIVALTRSAKSPAGQLFAKLDGVEVIEQNWVEVDSTWLREHQVTRVFVASHNLPQQFAEEGQFYLEALKAGVQYVVRISTMAANVEPSGMAYYPRAHWAIEHMLSQPQFSTMHFTSLQPNLFIQQVLYSTVDFIKKVREQGSQDGLAMSTSAAPDVPFAPIDSFEVGVVAAHLLVEADTALHNKSRYVLHGPTDITGEDIVNLAEKYLGEKIESVKYKDMSFVEEMANKPGVTSKNVVRSIKYAMIVQWDGKTTAKETSKEVLRLAAPKRTVAEVFDEMMKA